MSNDYLKTKCGGRIGLSKNSQGSSRCKYDVTKRIQENEIFIDLRIKSSNTGIRDLSLSIKSIRPLVKDLKQAVDGKKSDFGRESFNVFKARRTTGGDRQCVVCDGRVSGNTCVSVYSIEVAHLRCAPDLIDALEDLCKDDAITCFSI